MASREESSEGAAEDALRGEPAAAAASAASPETTVTGIEAGILDFFDIHFSLVTGFVGVSSMISSMYCLKSFSMPCVFICLLKS